jgi:hypothetical protein
MSDETGKNFEPAPTDAADRSKNDPPYESGKHLPTMPDPTEQDRSQVGDLRPDDDTEIVERRRAS